MNSSGYVFGRIVKAFGRVYPRCGMISQAIAFNVFLAFFPTLLFAVGFASGWIGTKVATLDAIKDFISFLPPGSQSIVGDFLTHRDSDIWKYAILGWAGTLLGGSQVMKLLMEGIHLIYEDEERIGFIHRQLRGLLLLLITMAPILIAGILGVFGRQLRTWLSEEFGKRMPVHFLWLILFPAVAMTLAMLALTVLYWVARPKEESLRNVLPGAAAATLLWWIVNAGFGFYIRRVPYSLVYGGLAAVIGLLIWMQISAIVVFLGAAWNAELATERRRGNRRT
jgi:YihY family inner membrane protein